MLIAIEDGDEQVTPLRTVRNISHQDGVEHVAVADAVQRNVRVDVELGILRGRYQVEQPRLRIIAYSRQQP